MKIRDLIRFIIIFNIVSNLSYSNYFYRNDNPFIQKNELIVIAGHTYRIIDSYDKQMNYINYINSVNPTKVIFLGDDNLNDNNTVQAYRNNINAQVYFSAGNHDLETKNYQENYINNIGYYYKLIETQNLNLYIINSSDSINIINHNLNQFYNKTDSNKIEIILSHHRLWDDNVVERTPFGHDKSFYFKELDNDILKRTDYIFSGNSPAQYFGKRYYIDDYPVNNNISYWVDHVEGIQCFSVGMHGTRGMSKNKIKFITIKYFNNQIIVNPYEYKINPDSENLNGKISRIPYTLKVLIVKLKSRLVWIAFCFGIFLTIVFNYLFIKRTSM
jgi:calcineurin-like phosphoesterase family protein